MFHLLLGINALTDLREGCVYNGLSLLLFSCSLWHGLVKGFGPWAPFMAAGLLLLRLMDPGERKMGRGDYLILFALSLYTRDLPAVLVFTSAYGLLAALILNRKQLPLIPFLFLGHLTLEVITQFSLV